MKLGGSQLILSKDGRNTLKKRNLITLSNSNSIVSDQFRTIRTNMRFLSKEKEERVFLITSPGVGEGKSTMTANLAVSLAQQKEKVLLVDANLRSPIIDQIFKIPNEVGLTDILSYKKTFQEAVHDSKIGKLEILTSGYPTSNPAELLGNEILKELLEDFGKTYDFVLVDSPSVLTSTETRMLANICDGIILVLTKGKTDLENAAKARRVLELAHANLLGAIINKK